MMMYFKNNIRGKLLGYWLFAVVILLGSSSDSFSQKSIEKKTPIINISYSNINSDSFFVQLSSGYKDEKFIPIEYQEIKLYFTEAIEGNFLGKVTTDLNGKGTVYLTSKFKEMIDTVSTFDFVAITAATKEYEEGSGSITIENTFLDLQTFEEDSVRTIRVFAYSRGKNGKTPLAAAEINFFVKRMVGQFLLSEESVITNDSGMAEIEYTIKDMPGDRTGTIDVGAKFLDADTYGNTMSYKKVIWGTKTTYDDNFKSIRALWATSDRVPIWLLVLVYSIIISVWGSILYILFQIYKMYKLGKNIKANK